MLINVVIRVNDQLFVKDPASSELGKRILRGSIDMIEEIGFEAFTFKKVAFEINSTEASIYRYFESKHKMLLYLTSWYWAWLEYKLVFGTANIESPQRRLERSIDILTNRVEEDGDFGHINEIKLHRIVVAESSKVYLTKEVDDENEIGAFAGYKRLVARVSEIILEIDPAYKYPHMLISTVIEGVHHQRYFAEHLPSLTNDITGEDSITEFYKTLVKQALNIDNNY